MHLGVPHWTAAGLLISLAAGAVAVLALARIAVLFLLVSPCGTFLAAGYTEALFLAPALPARLAAQRHAWALTATLTALATTVRISGLFLAAAIALTSSWPPAPTGASGADCRGWLFLPGVLPGLYTPYLHAHTGDWMAWKHAQERGWYRDFHAPWTAWSHTWDSAFAHAQTTAYAFMFQTELVAMTVGLVLLGVLLHRRLWPDALYIALSLWALGTSYWYTSIPRATLLRWPLWIGLAQRAVTATSGAPNHSSSPAVGVGACASASAAQVVKPSGRTRTAASFGRDGQPAVRVSTRPARGPELWVVGEVEKECSAAVEVVR
ncbi:hypothetical protein [Streptomyces exfoliatus]|uniref:hypothetical protein n=1 Tax=Streptomyces exfoliatus TaxID=1905 RepID=UPI003F4CB246